MDLIAPSGEVTLGLSQPEVGQGSYTALPQILADELDADWQRVTVRFVTGRAAYKIAFRRSRRSQKEGASMSTTALYQRLRIAGAAARDALTRAAAGHWKVATRMPYREGLRHQSARREAGLRRARGRCRRLPLNRKPPLKERSRFAPDRQAGRAPRHAGQVQRQRGLRHRRRVPGMLNAAITRRRPSPDRWSRSRTRPTSCGCQACARWCGSRR